MAIKNFEDKIQELESIIQRMESGDVPLREMMSLHEKGMALYNLCDKELRAFELRLKQSEDEG